MEKKKKLKKLVLRKEEIVNLNDYEMNNAKGGSTAWCGWSAFTVGTFLLTIAAYDFGENHSWWNCPYSEQNNCMTDVSNKLVWYEGIQYCEIPEVVVYGY